MSTRVPSPADQFFAPGGSVPQQGIIPGAPAFSGIGGSQLGGPTTTDYPSTTLPANPRDTPLWGTTFGQLFPDPSAGFVEGLGAPQPATKAAGGSSGGYVTGGNTALPGDIPQQGGDYGGLPPDQLGSGVAAGNDALQKIGAFAGNWIVRVGVIAAGVILIAAAAWNLAEEKAA